ncbi:MAG: Ig-like domain-containing protein [Candidatus Thorarchaeota archaeon]|jgi:hypothetical protein
MAVPVLQSTNPTDAATNIAVSEKITITFDVAVDRASITPATIMVFRSDDQEPIFGAYSFSTDSTVVQFIPSNVLAEDTLYKIKVVGIDEGTGSSVKSSTGDFLATTTTNSFRTGIERFLPLSDPAISDRDDLELLGPIREGSELAVSPTGGPLEIDSRTPKALASKILVSATGFHVNFDQTIAGSTVTTSTVVVEQNPVWGMTQYYASIPAGATKPVLNLQQTGDLTPPVGTLATEGDSIYYVLPSTDDFLHNTEVLVTITTEVESDTGAVLVEEDEYFFTTEYFPLFFGIRQLRLELGPVVASLADDTLCRIIHKNSIEAWELSGRAFNLCEPPYRYVQWVRCKSVLDVIATLSLSRDLTAGQTKTLGDFTLRSGPADPELGAKYRQATKCVEDIVIGPEGSGMAVAAVKGSQAAGERFDHKTRTWDHLLFQSQPGANMAFERGEKSRLSTEYAFDGKDSQFVKQFFIKSVPSTLI